jgi:hypothetical protein
MERSTLFPVLLSTVAGLVSVLPGCSKDDNNPVDPPPAGSARVMVIHASPDAAGVDLYVDNAKVDSGLTFLENTAYLTVNAGIRIVKVTLAGSTTAVIEGPVPVTANGVYSVFATDSVASLTPLLVLDTLTTPAAGKAHVRFFNLSPNAPPIDITLEDGTVVFGDLAFGEYTGFKPLDAGTHTLQIRAASASSVVLTLPPVTLITGKIYTVYAKGFLGVTTGDQAIGAQIILNN